MKKGLRDILYNSNLGRNYGVIGKHTGFSDLHVGDIVSYKYSLDKWSVGVITENTKSGDFYVMGLWSTPLASINYLHKVMDYKYLNEEWLENKHGLQIHQIEVKKMTLEQIEDEIGYPIEIVQS